MVPIGIHSVNAGPESGVFWRHCLESQCGQTGADSRFAFNLFGMPQPVSEEVVIDCSEQLFLASTRSAVAQKLTS